MLDPGWVSAGLLAFGMVGSAGVQIGLVRGMERRQSEETRKSDEFRAKIEIKFDQIRSDVNDSFVKGAVFGERLGRMEQEIEQRKLHAHEASTRVTALEARLDGRVETLERRLDALRGHG